MHLSRIFVFFLLFFIFAEINTISHPHLFIRSATQFRFKQDKLQSIRLTWRFDKMFSSTLIKDYDANRSRRFEQNEIVQLRNTAFQNLKRYGYFMKLRINGRHRVVRRVTGFTAWMRGNYVYYQFHAPINTTIPAKSGTIHLALFDPTYFTAITHNKHVRVSGLNRQKYELQIEKSRANQFQYGTMIITPDSIVINRK